VNYLNVVDSIAGTMQRANAPLSEAQKLLLVGCLSVWLQKAYEEGLQATREECDRFGGIRGGLILSLGEILQESIRQDCETKSFINGVRFAEKMHFNNEALKQ